MAVYELERKIDLTAHSTVSHLPTSLDGLFEPIMQRAVAEIGETSPLLEQIAAYHMGWRNADLSPIAGDPPNPGKRIRPRLAMLVTAALGADPAMAAPVAAAIELLHNFTLVHDDIQDQSHLRRHRPTVWSLWGEAQAINAGDALFASSHLALYELADREETAALLPQLVKAFDKTTLAIVGGQTMDIENEGDASVTVERYIATIAGKTSAIVEFSAWAGGLVGGATEQQSAELARFGLSTGLAFQIRDDLLGIWGTEAETGKTPADDIRRGKQTLPLIELRRLATPHERRELEAWLTTAEDTDASVRAILGLLSDYDMRAQVEQQIRFYHNAASAALGQVIPRDSSTAAHQLYALLDGLEHRSG
ncbi:MAG: polyprenyl synthetase family protein [Thermomicrobiales bacterium]|nr:polyprenyl synthetase family protein [Thermomicrobiales bacterium]MCO5221919.1 polyprenyl synthetase family protein [Thermomicrobiales bacterium]